MDSDSVAFLRHLIDSISGDNYNFAAEKERIVCELLKTIEKIDELEKVDFRKIGDYLYDGLYISDGKGKTIYVNEAYCRMTGLKAEEVLNKYVADLEKQGIYKNAVTPEVIKRKKQVQSIGFGPKTNVKMLITGTPIFDCQGNVSLVVITEREIKDLLALQAELEATQEKIKVIEKSEYRHQQEIAQLRKTQLNKNLIGECAPVKELIQTIHQVASLDVAVLIMGETGTGKEVVADEIYLNGLRKEKPFIKINCAAIPPNLLEAELFGYEKGSFTGASASGKIGMFELADKGTLFLDEIGDMPLELQPKLLRILQTKELRKIGGSRSVKLDVRIIAATNSDLKELVRQNKFRQDLYYRLNVIPIHLPPLRARGGDIALLANYFLEIYNKKYGKFISINPAGFSVLEQYSWPGNIRELQNVIERLVIVSDSYAVISEEEIAGLINVDPYYVKIFNMELSLKEIVANVEKKTLEKALAHYGSTRNAAKVLGIDQSTIVKKAKKLGITIKNDDKGNRV